MQAGITIYMNRRDITSRVIEGRVVQRPNVIYLEWSIKLAGTVKLEPNSTFDFYATTDPANPRANAILLNGVLDPSRKYGVLVRSDGARTVELSGYDRVWLLQRRTPRTTLVLGRDYAAAAKAVDRYYGTVADYKVVVVKTIEEAVRAVAKLGGVRVRWMLPTYEFSSMVVPPTQSYWATIVELTRFLAPYTYYWPEWNTLVFVGTESRAAGIGGTIDIGSAYKSIDVLPQPYRNVRRTLMRIMP